MRKDIKITQRKPVSWLDPLGLARTGVMAVQAALFGSYADRREMIAALSPNETKDPTTAITYAGPDVWFDYIADTGDGWNATYAIACLAGADTLHVLPADEDSGGQPVDLPRAQFTILGGDEVYPTASLENYKDRLTDPYWFAHSTGKEDALPKVYALPGNHDWYDGLTSFMRLFLQRGRRLGPWKTNQGRTYFAIELPYRWWIWGVDVQLESDIDPPQLDYFKHYAEKLDKDDRVILCTPEPSWVEGADDRIPGELEEKSKTHDNLTELEKLIRNKNAKIPLRIAGDLHHYARYEGMKDRSQLVTCGGGGAFLHSTHPLWRHLDLTKTFGQWFEQRCVFPSVDWCKKKRFGVFQLIQKNPKFAFAVAIVYALYAWILEAASRALISPFGPDASLLAQFAKSNAVLGPWWRVVEYSPLGALFTAAILIGPAVYGVKMKRIGRTWICPAIGGLVHGAAHLGLAVGLMWLATRVPYVSASVLGILIFVAVFGGIIGSLLMALYMLVANCLYHCHDEEVFSCQAIQDYKGFARFHLTKDGVTLYPIGLKAVPRKWTPAPGVHITSKTGRCEPHYELEAPDDTVRIFEPEAPYKLEPRLIERPISL